MIALEKFLVTLFRSRNHPRKITKNIYNMPSKTIFSPFSQKYILKENWLPDSPCESFRLLLNADMNWCWNTVDDSPYKEIIANFDALKNLNHSLSRSESEKEIHDQPLWKDETTSNYAVKSTPKEIFSKNNDDTFMPIPDWREIFAYYVPAHTRDKNKYGIHFIKAAIAKIASEIHDRCLDQPLPIIILATVYKIFAHEICHSWIEDICCLLNFHLGNSPIGIKNSYSCTNQYYNSYIYWEERICNTAAHGFLHQLLKSNHTITPDYDSEKILKTFSDWMRSQPKGYRDFIKITENPITSKCFLNEVYELLTRVYHPNDANSFQRNIEIRDVVNTFFREIEIKPDKNVHPPHNGFWAGSPPIHIQ